MTTVASARPLSDNRIDAELFTGRGDQVAAALAAVDHGLNTLVTGARGSGRSSFLRHVAYQQRTRQPDRPVVFVDAGLGEETADVLALVAERLAGPESTREHSWNRQSVFSGRIVQHPSEAGRLLTHLDRMRAHLEEEDPEGQAFFTLPGLVCLDNLPASQAHQLFGRLRDELWSVPLLWIVGADEDHTAAFLEPPADAFFEHRVNLPPLAADDARQLLARRLPDAPLHVVEALAQSHAPATPRQLLAAARRATSNEHSTAVVIDASTRAAHVLGRPAAMLVAEMQSRDSGVSASDEELLRRLGWTRARAAQVLRQLEGAGLVRSSLAPRSGPGRPRKVYELVSS